MNLYIVVLGRRGRRLAVCDQSESIPSPIHGVEEAKEFPYSDSRHHPAVLNESLSTPSSSLPFSANFKRYSLISIHSAEETMMPTGDEIIELPSRASTPIVEAYCDHCDSNGDGDTQEHEFQQSHPPWRAFFTHPVAVTLLVNGWVYVSIHRLTCFTID